MTLLQKFDYKGTAVWIIKHFSRHYFIGIGNIQRSGCLKGFWYGYDVITSLKVQSGEQI
jgi:hypothetical protein